VWVDQAFEPMDSGPHTDLGFEGSCLFIRPLSRPHIGETRFSLTTHAHLLSGAGLPRSLESVVASTKLGQVEHKCTKQTSVSACGQRVFHPALHKTGAFKPDFCKNGHLR
jgi:hypothetical protein